MPGTARFSEIEPTRLREYLLKGGFLFVSDYHGTLAREQFDERDRPRAAARRSFPIVDLTPPNHPMWHTMFQVTQLPQMASIQTWRRPAAGSSSAGTKTARRPTRGGSPMPTAD